MPSREISKINLVKFIKRRIKIRIRSKFFYWVWIIFLIGLTGLKMFVPRAYAADATNVSLTPVITLSATDAELDWLRYKLQIATDTGFTANLQTFDQTASQTGWSGQNSQTGTAYTSGTIATYTVQSTLSQNTTYYLRAYAVDPAGSNTWGNASLTFSFITTGIPAAPTISAPTNGATGVALTPLMQLSATDGQSDYLRYKIQLATDTGFTANLQTFDQTASQTGWSGQNAQTSTAYTSGTTASYTVQTALTSGTTYYIRGYAIDPAGTNVWSAAGTTVSFTTNASAGAPTISAPTQNQTKVGTTPAIALSATDSNSDWLRYKIQLCTDASFTLNCQTFDQTALQTGWSGQNAQTSTAYTSGATATYTLQSALTGKRYYIRAYAIDPGGTNAWSSASATRSFLTTNVTPGPCTSIPGGDLSIDESCSYTGSSEGADAGNMAIRAGSTFTLNADQSIVWNPDQSITIEDGASIALNSSAKLTQNYMYTASSGSSAYPDPVGFHGAVAVYHMDDACGCNTSGCTATIVCTGGKIFNSTGSNDGTATGTTIVDGKFGKGRSFNGTSDFISVGNLGTIQTVAFWVYPNTTSGEFVDLNGTAYINATAGTISATGFASPTIYVNGAAGNTITAGSWQHIAVTTGTGINASAVNIGKRGTSYFNGTIDDVYILNRALSATEIMGLYNPSLGGATFIYQSTNPDAANYRRRKDISSAAAPMGEWKLDEQTGSLSNTAGVALAPAITLSATDSDSDYLRYKLQIATDTGFTANLQTFDQTASQTGWSGQNSQTSTAYTSSATATYTIQSALSNSNLYYLRAYAIDPGGTNTWSSASSTVSFNTKLPSLTPGAGAAAPTVVPGRFSYARSFDGTDDYLAMGNNGLGALSGSFTIEAWVKTADVSQQTIISEYQSGTCQDGRFYIQANTGYLVFDNGNGTVNTGNVVVNDGVWHHAAYVYNSVTNKGKTYVDGIPGSDTTAAAWRNTCATTDTRVGSEVGANFFNGTMDNIRVYAMPISDVKMKQLYYNGYVTGCYTGAGYTTEAACPTCPHGDVYVDDGNCGKKLCVAC